MNGKAISLPDMLAWLAEAGVIGTAPVSLSKPVASTTRQIPDDLLSECGRIELRGAGARQALRSRNCPADIARKAVTALAKGAYAPLSCRNLSHWH